MRLLTASILIASLAQADDLGDDLLAATRKSDLAQVKASATPVTDGKHLAVFFGSEGLFMYDLNGKLLWKKDLGNLNAGWFYDPDYKWAIGASPVIYKNVVIVQCDIAKNSFIAAFDVSSGKEVWRTKRDEIPSWGSPTVVEGPKGAELVANGTGAIRGYDPLTGKVLWTLTAKNSEITTPTPFAGDGLVYVTSGYPPVQPIYAIRPGASAGNWSRIDSRARATISGIFNDLERSDNIYLVNHQDHSRSFSLAAVLTPNLRYGLDLAYGYNDVFSRTTFCYAATPAPTGPGAGAAPQPDCGTNLNLATGYYDAPTQYGSFGITLTPVKVFRVGAGYRISAVNGTTEFLNPLQVAGSLQSKYQTPYADVAWTFHPGWVWKGDWNHYAYDESGPVGPTLPRNFRADMLTLAVHYEF